MKTAVTVPTSAPAIWAPCGVCWGQRRIYQDLNGEGLVPLTCPGCLGVGARIVDFAPLANTK